MMYSGFHTQDGGPDGDLEKIVLLCRDIEMQEAAIDAGLLTHYDRTCRYFDSELPIIKARCQELIKLIEANGY